ncbi:MAG: hypothetical protein Q4C72_08095 [Eubacteriales bacterium]|nr:hypothetical protein [Eubacteriales bacterium]
MAALQKLLLGGFALFAALTIFQQVRYGMICGRAEGEDRQEDPKAKACQKRAVLSAAAGAVCLALCILIGALTR